jgi:hypothetical protein
MTNNMTNKWRQSYWRGAASVHVRRQHCAQPTVIRFVVGAMARAEGPLAVQVLPVQVLPIQV